MSIGRISTAETYRSAIGSVTDAQELLNQIQEKLATGKKILLPSDDPVAAAQITGIKTELQRLETYQTNTSRAQSALAFEDSALEGVEDVLQRARELAVAAQNAALTGDDLKTFGTEMSGLLERLVALGNTQNADGEYVFGGFSSKTQPYQLANGVVTANPTEGRRNINIASGLTVPLTDPGSLIFEAEPGNGGFVVSADPSNTGTGVVGVTTASPNFNQTLDYTVSFQAGGLGQLQWVVDDGVNPPVIGDFVEGDAIPIDGGEGSITITGKPALTDAFTLTGNGSKFGISAAAGGANTGAATVVRSSTTDAFDETLSYTLTFTDLGGGVFQWDVVDTAVPTPVTETGTYTPGEPIVFNGGEASITLNGVPADGDVFNITPTLADRTQSAFDTLIQIRDALLGSNQSLGARAITNTTLTQGLENLDRNLSQVSLTRTDVGVRLNRVDGQADLNAAFNLQLESSLADLEALDYAEAISTLNLQLVALQAAQQSFVKTTGITLFNYL